MEDAIDGFIQLGNNPILLICYIFGIVTLNLLCITGIAMTRNLSAVFRIVVDQGRPVLVWIVSISVPDFNQEIQPLQIVGFLIILLGILVFNDILIGKCIHFLNFLLFYILGLDHVLTYSTIE